MSMLHEEFRLEETPLQILQIIIANTANQYCRNYKCLSYMKKFRLEETPNVANIAGITDIANMANQYCRNYKCLSYMMEFRLEETPLQILQMLQISQISQILQMSQISIAEITSVYKATCFEQIQTGRNPIANISEIADIANIAELSK